MLKTFKYRLFVLGIVLCIIAGHSDLTAQLSSREKAQWIVLNFAENSNWTNEESITKYTIGVFGYTPVYNELVKLANHPTYKIKGKKFSIVQFKRVKDIEYTQVLFIPKTEDLTRLQEVLKSVPLNTLVVTEECPFEVYMINFTNESEKGKQIAIESSRARRGGITFNEKLLSSAGKEEDLIKLASLKDRELETERKKLEEQKAELAKMEAEVEQLKKENIKEREDNLRQREISKQQNVEIEKQKVEIEEQKVNLEKLQEDLAIQEKKLNVNQKYLNRQENRKIEQQKQVEKSNAELEQLNKEIEENKKLIESKDTEIIQQDTEIKINRLVMIGFSVLILLILVLAFYIWRGYKIKQRINDELRDKNIAINKQKEEIANQNQQTELLNKELEKLSIVASQTDNAVTIMDKDGNFEWINVGYTRMYGYTLQLLINEKDENIKNVSTHKDFPEIFRKCVEEKKTVVYDVSNTTRSGKQIWVQTSLTPILDVDGNVSKLITIGTDINRIKAAEAEIRKQHQKILEQTQQLEATNKELEKLSIVASETDNAISIMDAAGNFQWINEGYSRLYGYTYNQLINEYSGNIITQNMNPEVKALIKKCIEEQVPVSYENHRTTRTGKKIWVQTTLTPITDKEGNPRSIISISQDISRLKNAEQAIRQQSEELMAQKEELILQKNQIEQQNEHIKASISYAKTIQSAILPPERTLNEDFESFIIYRPKDIVSGDFYWHSYVPPVNGGKGKHFIAAVDCTGHGVPGAFMSMIGSRLLNEIVKERGVTQPSLILERMDHQIKRILRQEENENNDGMDVCLCSLEHVNNGTIRMVFSGAKRPLYFYKQKQKSLKYIKGTRKTIGGTQAKRNREVFADHEILLDQGDLLYLTTDGIIDQPSPERIRFGSLRFINLLKSIGDKPIEVQKEFVEQAILEFQGHEQQRDDVTFVGVKV